MQCGDIINIENSHYISNIAIPGRWKHTLIYLGSLKQVQELLDTSFPYYEKIMKMYKTQKEILVLDANVGGVQIRTFDQMANLKNDFMYARTLKDYSLVEKDIYLSRPSFTLSNENIKNNDKQSALIVFQDFIRKTGTDSIKYIAPFFREMTEDNLEMMIGKIENENGIKMSDELSGYIYNIFNYHQQKLNTVMNLEYQGGSKNDTGKSSRRI